jgi:NAD(P)-dependent dehydrogenase (short-subunit alcohol dehydrogenase family)
MAAAEPLVVLITGATSGIGKACAEFLASKGCKVYGTSRKGGGKTGSYEVIRLDVTDDRSVEDGIGSVLALEKRLDLVVNNAGIGIAGAVETTSVEEAKTQFETNFFGTFRVCRAVLPAMRARGSGTIVNMSSIGGIIALPFQALYSAAKFAVEGLTEALRMEVRPFGIRVVLVEPGDFKTGFTGNRVRTKASATDKAYYDQFATSMGIMERDEQRGPTPERIAETVWAIAQAKAPRLRYRVGMFAQTFAVSLKSILPGTTFESIIRSTYKL